jgi:hypothetical protein
LPVLLWAVSVEVAAAPDVRARTNSGTIGIEVANLQDQLENGLRARLPQEFAFLRRVVTMVERNQLPLPLVVSTFHWARRQPTHPFPHFVRALRIRAGRLGIEI